jgi:predicted Ser/Thr protein kinase
MKRNISSRTSWQRIEGIRTANEDEKEKDEAALTSEVPLQRINEHCKQKYEWKVLLCRGHIPRGVLRETTRISAYSWYFF